MKWFDKKKVVTKFVYMQKIWIKLNFLIVSKIEKLCYMIKNYNFLQTNKVLVSV